MNRENSFFVNTDFNLDAAGFIYCDSKDCNLDCGRKKQSKNIEDRVDLSRYCSDYIKEDVKAEIENEINEIECDK